MHYDTDEIKDALKGIRTKKREDVDISSLSQLRKSAYADASAVTLTLIGYKGGQLEEQINQDRSIILSPFLLPGAKEASKKHPRTDQERILVGVFDGHAARGEMYVSARGVRSIHSILVWR